mmetsp:Transcript_25215/g.29632  ORF Transcript_25215/g.29632 Transcript_25215/m.29632 type:complete len:121 (+) Transcript_25215:445-807(+)
MPAALAIASGSAGAGSEPRAESTTTEGAAGSQPAAPTQNAVAPCDFSPLQDLDAAVVEFDPFAQAKTGEEAESSNKSAQVSQANCLRFSPTLSSSHVVITNNGKCASSQGSISPLLSAVV